MADGEEYKITPLPKIDLDAIRKLKAKIGYNKEKQEK
jgi:hypothetical protein